MAKRKKRIITDDEIIAALAECSTVIGADAKLNTSHGFTAKWLKKNMWAAPDWFKPKTASEQAKEGLEIEGDGDKSVVTLRSKTIRTLEDALAEAKVDLAVWEVERYVVNKWDVAAKVGAPKRLMSTELWQVKVWLKKKAPTVLALEAVLKKIEDNSPIVPLLRKVNPKEKRPHRALEIDIFDPHYGMQCYKPASDASWSLEECEHIVMWAVHTLLELTACHAPYDEIVFPFGNDWLHSDNVFHTTTQGTFQPESLSWQHIYQAGAELAVKVVDRLIEAGPVFIPLVPGNHARQSEFTLATFLKAYYRNNKNVNVDCSSRPYKFWNFGVNLIGFEHGHSVTSTRLAALMANETRNGPWKDARWCEWHLGDQHRKASGKPSHFEEQGVSVEFLSGLTPPNEWHAIKSFNFQKRCANAFIYDRECGPVARYQVNIDSYTGKPLGSAA